MTHVQKETAQLLKEKGFDVMCNRFIDTTDVDPKIKNGGGSSNWNACTHYVSIPCYQAVLDWLRSKGVHVYVTCTASEWYFSIQNTKGYSLFNSTAPNSTHDLAIESGIIHALKHYVK